MASRVCELPRPQPKQRQFFAATARFACYGGARGGGKSWCVRNKAVLLAARYAGIHDKRNIVLSMAIAGALSAAGASLYFLSGNTEFFWTTYQSLPGEGFNGIPVALLALNNPIGVVFAGIFMAMLNIVGLQLTNLTAFNEFITDVIISVIVYLSAFSLVIRMLLTRRKKREAPQAGDAPAGDTEPPTEPKKPNEPEQPTEPEQTKGGAGK